MATRLAPARARRPGILMPFPEYRTAPGIHFSTLKFMGQSPLHYRYAQDNPPAETQAMLLGRATHTAVFEPMRFQLDYAIWQGDRRGTAYQQFADEAAAQGRSILKEGEYNTALAIRDSVRGIPEIAALLERGQAESSFFWVNPQTGLACKGRLDWIASEGAVLDLKTASTIDPREFSAHAWRMGYFHQATMYQEAYAITSGTGTVPRFGIIAVEKEPPHACRLFWLDPDSLSRAWTEYQGWLRQVKDCIASDTWPGPGPVESELAAPSWAMTEDEAVDFGGLEE
ncbi:MAG TPA: PD-(D/E)XK nuclease-like domain-containing protein [Candidatus Fermentibacter daniensis]|nr:PD-(D/E)XK nuclease-like domain-containing protein [Candidatus Fermentibacter daniensis]HOR08352.1 PD-(D/E)XK nuclease-like domain-containing protein [Candidatus Fermentibacter daniensis]HPK52721.1 PD-(D/E)XK nuclease-like domain-containing protein [Candidatus Fermentibacter daniensis]